MTALGTCLFVASLSILKFVCTYTVNDSSSWNEMYVNHVNDIKDSFQNKLDNFGVKCLHSNYTHDNVQSVILFASLRRNFHKIKI